MYSEKTPPLAGAVCGQRKSSVSFTSESEEGGAAAKLRLSSRRVSYRLELPMTTEQHHQALKQTSTPNGNARCATARHCARSVRSGCPALPLQVARGVWLCAPVRLPRILGPDRPHLQAKVQGVPGYPTCNAIGLYRTRPLQYDRVSRLFRYPCLGEVVESASGGAINDRMCNKGNVTIGY